MKVEIRTEPLKVVRANKKVPGVLFGKTIDPQSIQMDEHDINAVLKEYGQSQTFKIQIGKKTHQVYIKDLQRDIINQHLFLNFKLQKVSKDDTIKTDIVLYFIGKEVVEKPGVLLHIVSDSVEVEFPVNKGVSHIDVDISKLEIGDSVHAKDLVLPEGLTLLDDPEKTLVHVTEVSLIEEEEDEDENAEDEDEVLTEPEIIKQKD